MQIKNNLPFVLLIGNFQEVPKEDRSITHFIKNSINLKYIFPIPEFPIMLPKDNNSSLSLKTKNEIPEEFVKINLNVIEKSLKEIKPEKYESDIAKQCAFLNFYIRKYINENKIKKRK